MNLEVSRLDFSTRPNLDEVEALNQKRTLAFINHWVYRTVLFLNQFAKICEQKLQSLENKLTKAEDLLLTIESKLSSIPGLDVYSDEHTQPKNQPVTEVSVQISEQVDVPESTKENTAISENEKKNLIPISSHPDFVSFFKMVNFGVPKDAVKLKMSTSGFNPSLLDDPLAEVEYEGNEYSKNSSLES